MSLEVWSPGDLMSADSRTRNCVTALPLPRRGAGERCGVSSTRSRRKIELRKSDGGLCERANPPWSSTAVAKLFGRPGHYKGGQPTRPPPHCLALQTRTPRSQRAIACNGRRRRRRDWQQRQSRICNLRVDKAILGFESHRHRHAFAMAEVFQRATQCIAYNGIHVARGTPHRKEKCSTANCRSAHQAFCMLKKGTHKMFASSEESVGH